MPKTTPENIAECEISGDFFISHDGDWFHDGGIIGRKNLVKLFATVLRIDGDGQYWLQTPVEKVPVRVEDVPFLVVNYKTDGTGKGRTLIVVTNIDQNIDVGPDHPIVLRRDRKTQTDLPYVDLGYGLYARLNRAVFHDFVTMALNDENNLMDDGKTVGLWVGGCLYPLGDIDA